MNELFTKEQTISVVPQDFRNAVKGKVVGIGEKTFELEVKREPKGILINNLIEFYSQTQHGVLYFKSDVVEIKENILKVLNPIKHRFLQRRQFTRINFSQNVLLSLDDKDFEVVMSDLSAGGMKIHSSENINIDFEYALSFSLLDGQVINCVFQPIRIEKQSSEQGQSSYTLSGRFKNISNIDRMTLIQFCMKKKIENSNK